MIQAMIIRAARADDVDAIARMLMESAESQGEPGALCVTAADLLREGFGDVPRFHALLADADGTIVGLALYVFHFSTWTSVNGIHLEDLYVDPAWRGRGVAHALMAELADIARQTGCRRLRWFVLRSNDRARRFYESIGAELLADWIYMQLDPTVETA
jgi:GNAT superfamily N-acetyltransferase